MEKIGKYRKTGKLAKFEVFLVITPKSFYAGGYMGYKNLYLDETHRMVPKNVEKCGKTWENAKKYGKISKITNFKTNHE